MKQREVKVTLQREPKSALDDLVMRFQICRKLLACVVQVIFQPSKVKWKAENSDDN